MVWTSLQSSKGEVQQRRAEARACTGAEESGGIFHGRVDAGTSFQARRSQVRRGDKGISKVVSRQNPVNSPKIDQATKQNRGSKNSKVQGQKLEY